MMLKRRLATVAATMLLAAHGIAHAAPQPPGFDIWLAPVSGEGELRNLTSRPGYDNQPAFESENRILFTRIADDVPQTDLARLDIASGEVSPLLVTPESEYSPTPNDRGTVSAVRVSMDGVQQLWELPPGADRYEPLLAGIEGVGYHLWLDPQRVALFIVEQPSELHIANLDTGKVLVLAKDIGRSMHRPPGTRNVIAFTEPGQEGKRWIKTLDLDERKLVPVAPVLEGSQDFAYLPDGRIVMASGKTVYAWQQGKWQELAAFPDLPGDISRIAVSPSGERLALVVAEDE